MYIDITYANKYLGFEPDVYQKWNALSDDDKNLYLTWATNVIDKQVWIGTKLHIDQVNEFPRVYMNTIYTDYPVRLWNSLLKWVRDDLVYSEYQVPESIRKACLEIIKSKLDSPSKFQSFVDMQNVGITDFKAGDLEVTMVKATNDDFCKPARDLSSHYLSSFWTDSGIKGYSMSTTGRL